jgi:hypothetical protein
MIPFSPVCFSNTVIIKAAYDTNYYVICILHYVMHTGFVLKETLQKYAFDLSI